MLGDDEDFSNQIHSEQIEEKRKSQYRQQAHSVISQIDCNSFRGRQVIAKSYRRINRIIDTIERDKFNFNQEIDLVEDVLNSAFFYKPFNMVDPSLKFRTVTCRQNVRGSRRLKPPAIYIEHELVKPDQKSLRVNSNKTEVTLKIQTQPSSDILYTNIPNAHPYFIDAANHPLLQPPNDQKYFLLSNNSETINIIHPPCEINVIAQSDFKLESKLISLKISSQMNGGDMGQNYQFAVRPMESFPFEQSAYSSEQASSSNIDEALMPEQREHE